ncbi:hypothetical protein NMY22_g2906 [Coprinellus aureogranulatus]|nr:hypothetical protein NMY22_g2906 [Coprinellus aureogranulatus]
MDELLQQDWFLLLPGAFRVSLGALTKYWPREPVTFARLAGWCSGSNFSTTWALELNRQYPAWLYAFIAFLAICVAAQLFDDTPSSTLPLRNASHSLSTPHEALATLFTPVSSCHPKHYRPILAHISSLSAPQQARNSVILDFEKTWRALVHGRLELRDDSALKDLFTVCSGSASMNGKECGEGGVCVFGCHVSFGSRRAWRASAFFKLLFALGQVWIERCRWRLGIRRREEKDVRIPNLDNCLVDDTLDLDFIPIPYVASAISVAKRRLALDNALDYDDLNVEFTCLARDIGFMSKRYLLCCAILLPSLGHNLSKSKKTALPFFGSIEAMVRRLEGVLTPTCSPGKAKSIIKAVNDISMLHADALELHENDMVFDTWVRSSFVARHGPDAWRETRLRLKWEAALLRAKVLVRWKVTVALKKPGH